MTQVLKSYTGNLRDINISLFIFQSCHSWNAKKVAAYTKPVWKSQIAYLEDSWEKH